LAPTPSAHDSEDITELEAPEEISRIVLRCMDEAAEAQTG